MYDPNRPFHHAEPIGGSTLGNAAAAIRRPTLCTRCGIQVSNTRNTKTMCRDCRDVARDLGDIAACQAHGCRRDAHRYHFCEHHHNEAQTDREGAA